MDPCLHPASPERVSTAAELYAAVRDPVVSCILLAAPEFYLVNDTDPGCGNSSLYINHSLSLTAASSGHVVLDAKASSANPRRVLNIETPKDQKKPIHVFLNGLIIRGGHTDEKGNCSGGGGIYSDALLTLNGSEVRSNAAHGNGGGIFSNNEMILNNTLVTQNEALQNVYGEKVGGGIYLANRGHVALLKSRIFANCESGCEGRSVVATGTIPTPAVYVLPAPAGFYMPATFPCKKPTDRCQWPNGTSTNCPETCDYENPLFRDKSLSNLSIVTDHDVPFPCPLGHYCSNRSSISNPQAPRPCPAGTIGNAIELNSSACNGECPQGSYCEEGSAAALNCPEGTYGNASGLVSERNCSECSPGAWCTSGKEIPCPQGTYSSASNASNINKCRNCPLYSTTNVSVRAISVEYCMCLKGSFENGTNVTTGEPCCIKCPKGFDCDQENTSTRNANVEKYFWRPTSDSSKPKRCPYPPLCTRGLAPVNFSLDSKSTCEREFQGPYCTTCSDSHKYMVATSAGDWICTVCPSPGLVITYALGIPAGALASLMLFAALLGWFRNAGAMPPSSQAPVHQPRIVAPAPRGFLASLARSTQETLVGWRAALARICSLANACTLGVKLKICIGFWQVVSQVVLVYRIDYPIENKIHRFVQWFQGENSLFPWLNTFCIGLTTFESKLHAYTFVPLSVVLAAFGISFARRRSLLPALPFVLCVTFLLSPISASLGYQALAECDCFDTVSGRKLCFLPADYRRRSIKASVICSINSNKAGTSHAPVELLAVAIFAVGLYGVAVPLSYAVLLYRVRKHIRNGSPSKLKDAVGLLYAGQHPSVLWWQPVESLRTFTLCGVYAMIQPGSVMQILIGVVTAGGFALAHVWCAPYKKASDNLLGLLASGLILLALIGCLAIEIASQDADIDLEVVVSAIVTPVFALGMLYPCMKWMDPSPKQIGVSELRQMLLEGDPDASTTDGDEGMSIVTRFGDFSISADEVNQALHAPLLTPAEVQTVQSISTRAVGIASHGSDRYTANVNDLVLSAPSEAARGVFFQLGISDEELHQRMSRGVEAIKDECAAYGTDEDKRYLAYVLEEPAGLHEGIFEEGRAGQPLAYFVEHPRARAAGLSEAHVVALRWYTTPAHMSINEPLRDRSRTTAHPFAATVAFLAEAIRRLRAVNASETRAQLRLRLWRGLRNVRTPAEMIRLGGGTELGLVSCTSDISTASRYAKSTNSLLYLVNVHSFMQSGAFVQWISCFPNEEECVYPPCTYLKLTGRSQIVPLNGNLHCLVLEVTPHQ